MEKRWCSACGNAFEPRPQSPRQAYCPERPCQRVRKRLWQRTKRQTDHDYHDNQRVAQEAWSHGHPGYWRQYRADHPEYTAANRELQKIRNARANPRVAKDDASPESLPVSGLFRLIPVSPSFGGKQQGWIVRLTLVAAA